MRCIFFTEQSYTDQRFGRLCNPGLPKKLRFSLQRHKTQEFGLRRIPEIVYRFPSWSVFSSLELGTLFPNSAQAGFGGFGLGLLVSTGFFDAKAPLEPAGCVRIQRKLDSGALAYGFWEEMAFLMPKRQWTPVRRAFLI